MATLSEEVQAFLDAELTDEDGYTVDVELGPPVPEAQRREIADILGPLPADVIALYDVCSFIEEQFLDGGVCFDAAERDFAGVFDRCVRLGGDGFGNFWVVDVAADGSWGPVFFACHDPASLVIQAPDLATFLRQLREADHGPADPMRTVHDEATMRAWRDTAPGVSREQAMRSDDAKLAGFAAQQPGGTRVVDLRERTIGTGWSGEMGLVARDGLLFAVAGAEEEEGPAPTSWWRRLLGW